jgi:hypothetical protein
MKVEPSGGAFARAAVATMVPAPGRFSTRTERFKLSFQAVISSMTKPAYYGIIEVENTWSHHAQTNSKLSCVTNVG